MKTKTVILTKKELAIKNSLDMIQEWCVNNLKGTHSVNIPLSCVEKEYRFCADATGFRLVENETDAYCYTMTKKDPIYKLMEGRMVVTKWHELKPLIIAIANILS